MAQRLLITNNITHELEWSFNIVLIPAKTLLICKVYEMFLQLCFIYEEIEAQSIWVTLLIT